MEQKDFTCQKCGFCCQLDVKLDEEDINNINELGKKNFFIENEDGFFLKREHNLCVFYNNKTCKIYNQRPGVCRRFPLDIDGTMSQKCKQMNDFSSKVVQKIVKFMNEK